MTSQPTVPAITPAAALDAGLARMSGAAGETLAEAIDARARRRLLEFVALLQKWNRVYNLTAVRDPLDMLHRHLLDSLSLLPWLPMRRTVSRCSAVSDSDRRSAVSPENTLPDYETFDLLDIGSGAGLPSIPLAIVRPDLRILSIDTNGKKTRFQQQAKLELGLSGLSVRQVRIETLASPDADIRAVCVTARAFTDPKAFLELASAFCSPDGYALMMLGRRDGVDALPVGGIAGFAPPTVHAVQVPGVVGQRHLAICHRR